MCQKWKPGPGVLFKTKKPANTRLFLFLITVQTLGKKKNPLFSQIHFAAISLFCWFSVRVARLGLHHCADLLARSVSAVRIALRAGVRTSQISLSISACFSSHCTPPPPPFFIMLSHVNPSSSLNAVHFWVHSNVIVCCSSSLFFFLSLTFHCQRF